MKFFFYRQGWHLLSLVVLIPIAWLIAEPALGEGSFLGVEDTLWFLLSISGAVIHQIIVWMIWRLQLGWSWMTRLFGKADLTVWGIIFLPLLFLRPIFIAALALSNRSTLPLSRELAIFLGVILLIPALYTLWSVFRYFGVVRAMGADHFREKYRKMPLVREGAFRFSGNAMYTFAFLLLWAIGLFQGSLAAIAAAGFQHVYIWVHHYCTENPHMDILFGDKTVEETGGAGKT